MAIRVQIYHDMTSNRFQLHGETFDVDLFSMDELEFPGIDIRAMMSAQAIGLDIYDTQMDFYTKYTGEDGFLWFLSGFLEDFVDALEEQGYENFNDGNFSKPILKQLLIGAVKSEDQNPRLLTQINYTVGNIFSAEEYRDLLLYALETKPLITSEVIELLKPFYDETDEDGNRVYDEKYVKALISALSKADDITDVLEELQHYLDEDDIDYTSERVFSFTDKNGRVWVQQDQPWEETYIYENKIGIRGKTFYKWITYLISEILDPIHFHSYVNDLGEDDSEFNIPTDASTMLAYFDMDEKEHDPEPPDHPKTDENGEHAVLYLYEGSDNFPEETIVPYAEKYKAKSAMELSQFVMWKDGDQKDWKMGLLKLVDDEWEQDGPLLEYRKRTKYQHDWLPVEED